MTTDPLDGWVFERRGLEWIGINITIKRRTALKGSEDKARSDALLGRWVCRQWPECPHRDPDECTRAIKAQSKNYKQGYK